MKRKLDRRVRRTRRLLRDALVALILEKGYQKITVQDIIDRADVGRSTFYSHFRDKDDLLLSGFDELAHDLHRHMSSLDAPTENIGNLPHSLDFFIHAQDNKELYIAMTESGGGELLLEVGRQHMQNHIQAHLNELVSAECKIPIPLITNYLAGSLLSTIIWWLEQEFPYTPKEMADMFNALAMPGVWNILSLDDNQG